MSNNKYCEQCGELINNEAKFCSSCGKEVKNHNLEKINKTHHSKNFFCTKCNLSSTNSAKCNSCGNSNRENISAEQEQEETSKTKGELLDSYNNYVLFFVGIFLIYISNIIKANATDSIIQILSMVAGWFGAVMVIYPIYRFFKN